MGTSGAEAPEVEIRPAVHVTSELGLGGGEMATFKTADARGYTPVLEAQASVLHGDRSEQAGADRGGDGTAALRGGLDRGPEDRGGSRRPLGRQTHEPQREREISPSREGSRGQSLWRRVRWRRSASTRSIRSTCWIGAPRPGVPGERSRRGAGTSSAGACTCTCARR